MCTFSFTSLHKETSRFSHSAISVPPYFNFEPMIDFQETWCYSSMYEISSKNIILDFLSSVITCRSRDGTMRRRHNRQLISGPAKIHYTSKSVKISCTMSRGRLNFFDLALIIMGTSVQNLIHFTTIKPRLLRILLDF